MNPTENLIRTQLGSYISFYMMILGTSARLRKQWQFIKGNGWLLKVDDTRNALYYLIACEDGIVISLTVRDAEREAFLCNEELGNIRSELESATKYSEGYAIRFEITTIEECNFVANFLILHINERMSKITPAQKALQYRGKHLLKQTLISSNLKNGKKVLKRAVL
jgi:hypothetical protein